MSQLQFEQTFSPGEIRVVCTASATNYPIYNGSNKNLKFVQTAIIQAPASNVGNIYLGGSTVSTSSLVLAAGQSISLGWMLDIKASAVLDLSTFYVRAVSAGDVVNVLVPIRIRGAD